MDTVSNFSEALLNGGFAGFSAALLCILCWVLKKLIKVIEDNVKAVTELTRLIVDAREAWTESHHILLQLRETVKNESNSKNRD